MSVKKLNIKTIGELKMFLPEIEKQILIGKLYRQSIIQHDFMIKQAEDIKAFMIAFIRRMEED